MSRFHVRITSVRSLVHNSVHGRIDFKPKSVDRRETQIQHYERIYHMLGQPSDNPRFGKMG